MIEIEISSNTALDAFNRWLALGREPDEALQVIGAALENNLRARFETKTDPNGSSWAAWSPATVASYPQNGIGEMLRRTKPVGDMFDSLSYQVQGGNLMIGFGAVSTNKNGEKFAYSAAHEFGTQKMPRRGLLLADPEAGTLGAADEAAIVEALREALSR